MHGVNPSRDLKRITRHGRMQVVDFELAHDKYTAEPGVPIKRDAQRLAVLPCRLLQVVQVDGIVDVPECVHLVVAYPEPSHKAMFWW